MTAGATWSRDRSVAPSDTPWRGSRLPDPDDALAALWGADTGVIDLTGGPGAVTGRRGDPSTHHRRQARTRRHPRPDVPATVAPTTGSRLAGAARALLAALARGVGGLLALGVAWVILVTLRHEQQVAYRDAIAAELDAAVIETLTTDHVLSVATWVGYVASTVLLGGLVFERFVAHRQVRLRFGTTVVVGLLAAGAALPLRAAGLLVLGASLGSRAGAGGMRGFARIVGGAIVVASYLLIGHPQANDPTVLEVGALTVHLLAVATWLGGIAVLANELRPRPAGGGHRLSNEAVARFSRIAEAMVVLVLGSGVVLAEGQNALSTAPWRTGYGLALTVKLCFVGVVLLIGGYNKLRVVPAIAEKDSAAARRHLRSTCVVEAIVISMGVLLMTAAMTSGGF